MAFEIIAYKIVGCIFQYCSCVVVFFLLNLLLYQSISRHYNKSVEKWEKYFVFVKYISKVFFILYFAVSHRVFERKYLKYIFEKYFSILYLKYNLKVFYTTLLTSCEFRLFKSIKLNCIVLYCFIDVATVPQSHI